jgi:diguanylate cyclase (GGDEF)-like protein
MLLPKSTEMTDLRPPSRPSGAPHRRGVEYRRRVGGAMLVAAGLLGATVVVLPGAHSTWPLVLCSLAALAVGATLVTRPLMVPRWASQALIGGVTVLIALAAASSHAGGRAGDVEVFYVLTAVYAFYFFPIRAALGQVAFAGLAYGWVLWGNTTASTGLARWATTVTGMLVAGAMVRAMNREVDHLVGELDATAARDPLTGVLNRRGLGERLGIELTRARRTAEPLTVIAVDLDGLKEINDEHGHAAGDEALALAAGVMRSVLRDVDVLARFGGDEFLVLLPNCDLANGERIAETLRGAVARAAEGGSWPVTISLGVACGPPLPLDEDALTGAADEALYEAKGRGRDRVESAGEGHGRPLQLD